MSVGESLWLIVLTALFVANLFAVHSEAGEGKKGVITFGAFAIGCVGFSIGTMIGGMQ